MNLKPQVFRAPDGTEMVILTKEEYDRLASLAEEDEEDVAIFDERVAEIESGKVALLPPEVSQMMLRGDTLLKALRKWRNLNQLDLVPLTGLAQGYISDLESGKKKGTLETLKKLALALKVDPAWLDAGA
jgi:DNA-binding Xre family transcriptional regulator